MKKLTQKLSNILNSRIICLIPAFSVLIDNSKVDSTKKTYA